MDLSPFRDKLHEYLGIHGVRPNSSGLAPCILKHHMNDTKPSFGMGGPNGDVLWHCFGCGEGGDIFDFASIYYGLPGKDEAGFYEVTLIQIANQLGMEYTPPKNKIQNQQPRLDYYAAMRHIVSQLTLKPVEKFIKDRGWDLDVAKRFGVGALTNPQATIGALKRQFSEEFLKEIGLITDKGYPHGTLSKKRIIFPIFNKFGAPIAFNSRTIGEPGEKEPKYINSVNNKFFKKGNVLYNFHRVRRTEKELYVVEGPTDAISLVSAGVDNVVALSGTALSDIQVKELSIMDKITFILDSDGAGIKAGLRAIEKMPNIYLKLMPLGTDPDQMIRDKGVDAFHDLEYLTPLDFNIEIDNYDHPRETARKYIDLIFRANPLDHKVLVDRLSKKTGFDTATIAEGLTRKMNKAALAVINRVAEGSGRIYVTILPEGFSK